MITRGSKIIIHKPMDIDEAPGWVTSMNYYDGMECTVAAVNKRPSYCSVEIFDHDVKFDVPPEEKDYNNLYLRCVYKFNLNWCEEVLEFNDFDTASIDDFLREFDIR